MRSRAITLGTSSENNGGAPANPEWPQIGQSAFKSSGTSPNFRNTVASWKSPGRCIAGAVDGYPRLSLVFGYRGVRHDRHFSAASSFLRWVLETPLA
jgi:hypothetical protein